MNAQEQQQLKEKFNEYFDKLHHNLGNIVEIHVSKRFEDGSLSELFYQVMLLGVDPFNSVKVGTFDKQITLPFIAVDSAISTISISGFPYKNPVYLYDNPRFHFNGGVMDHPLPKFEHEVLSERHFSFGEDLDLNKWVELRDDEFFE